MNCLPSLAIHSKGWNVSDKNIESIHRLTATQEGILFHTLEAPDSGVYFEQYSCLLSGPMQQEIFASAWNTVAARHGALRTLFTWEQRSQPLQLVRRNVAVPFDYLDWSTVTEAEQASHLRTLMQLDRDRGFDLTRAPLIRITLIRLDDDRHRMLWSFHHLILDGWSMRLVLSEVMQCYAAAHEGRVSPLQKAPAYADFLTWYEKRNTKSESAYWRDALEGVTAATTLQTAPCNVPISGQRGSRTHLQHKIPGEIQDQLKESARQNSLTLNTLVIGAWAVLLSRYAESNDVVFGTTVAGRPPDLEGVEAMAGLFINTLALRARLDEGQPTVEFLRELQRTQTAMQAFQQTPLTVAQRCSDIPPGSSLLNSLVVFENFPAKDKGANKELLKIDDEMYFEYSNFPLALLVVPGEDLEIIAVFDPQAYSDKCIERLLRQLDVLLRSMAITLDDPVGSLPILPSEEKQQQLEAWNDTVMDLGEFKPLNRIVAEWAIKQPAAVAVTDGSIELSYSELMQAVRRLATRLSVAGAKPGGAVVVYTDRSVDSIVAVLAVLESSAAYVVVDPAYPAARFSLVLEDLATSGGVPPVVVTQSHLRDRVLESCSNVVCLDGNSAPIDNTIPDYLIEREAPAYIMYTSGSTGRPKGVVVSHGNLFNSTRARRQFYSGKLDAFLLLSSLATDSSVAGMFWALAEGGRLVVPRPRAEQDLDSLGALIRDCKVSHTLCVPTLYSLMLDGIPSETLQSLRWVVVAGEACDRKVAEKHFRQLPGAQLANEYGPSEATVWATAAILNQDSLQRGISIGGPIANTRVYVLDQRNRPQPTGARGELYIAGANVASGYFCKNDATDAAFLPDPFAGNGLMYRTGDRVRWMEDGQLEFIGRVDHQLKVRGFRIEPAEIESALTSHTDITEAVVLLESGDDADTLTELLRTLPASDAERLLVEAEASRADAS